MTGRAVLVLAYQEEKEIGRVLASVNKAKRAGVIDRIIVVDDGSRDQTSAIARKTGAEVVSYPHNQGKAFAFYKGVAHLAASPPEYVVVLDADLQSFEPREIQQLLEPLERNPKQQMSIGAFFLLDTRIKPDLSGERAIRFSALQPLIKGSLKWRQYFGLQRSITEPDKMVTKERMGYALERALDRLLLPKGISPAQVVVETRFHSLRTKSRHGWGTMGVELKGPGSIEEQRQFLAIRLGNLRTLNRHRHARMVRMEREKIRYRK